MKITFSLAFAVVLTLNIVSVSASQAVVIQAQQQLATHTEQMIEHIERQSGKYLTFEQEIRIKLNLMAKHLIARYPDADLTIRMERAKIDYQLEDISQQRQLMINLQVLEDDGAGLIPPK